jgi:hypothetical protein
VCAIFEALCSVFKALCLVSDGHYTEFGNCSVSNEEKGRHALITCVSHLRKWEMCSSYACLILNEKRDARSGGASLFYLTAQKRISTEYSPQHPPCASTIMVVYTWARTCVNGHSTCLEQEAPRGAQVV